MRQELDDALCRDFPNTFYKRHGSFHEPLTSRGFECQDGWEPLIRSLAEALETYILTLPQEERASVAAVQVKEKFGGLRFYVQGTLPEELRALLWDADDRSREVCEVCGERGRSRAYKKMIVTRCEAHARHIQCETRGHEVRFNGGNPWCSRCDTYLGEGGLTFPATMQNDGTLLANPHWLPRNDDGEQK